jgi:hypothetical protein
MTTDITELAPAMKAAAEKLGGAQWQTRKGFSGIEVIVKGSLEKLSGFTSFQPVAADLADTKTARAIALFSPANILALVEALEKAQQYAKERDAENQDLMLTVGRLRVEREGQESRTVKIPGWFVKDAIAVYDRDEIEEALTAAGIKVEAE